MRGNGGECGKNIFRKFTIVMKYFLAIIGGGPAGYTAAELASKA